ncbi:nuclear transport factor 2 [Brachionichthys hirsutus]|uniref:nuclear transport factor 2 n=1 Tax=Brachionichthys hirsutus TaxID=412623 RepID=UPI003604BA6B
MDSQTKAPWEAIGSCFVDHYYRHFETDRSFLQSLYIDSSCLTWEGEKCHGKKAIIDKLTSLPFKKIKHCITTQDHQPTPDSCVLSMVVGQLKADEDLILGFHQSFLLKCMNNSWVCMNDVFRLALHNFDGQGQQQHCVN